MPQQAQIDAIQELWGRYQIDPTILSEDQVAGLTELRSRWGLAEPLEISALSPIGGEPQFEPAVAASTAQQVVIPEPPKPTPPPEPKPEPEIRPLGVFEAARAGLKVIGKDTPIDRFSEKVAEFVAGDPESDLEPGIYSKYGYKAPSGPQAAQIRKTLRTVAALPWSFTLGFLNDIIKDPGGTVLGIQDAVVRGFKNFAILQNPRGTEEQREKVYDDLVQDPTQFALAALVVHGFSKPLAARNIAKKAAKETLTEAPRMAEKAPVRPVEAAKPEARPEAPAKPVKPAEAKIIGLNVKESTRIRRELGLDKLDPAERRTWEATLSEAKRQKTDYSAFETADELLKSNRPITDAEHAGMVLKAADLANQYDGMIRDINALIEKGDMEGAQVARIRAETTIGSLDKLTEATRLGRREAARALSIGRMMINRETYDLAHVMQRAQATKGAKLSPKQVAKIEELTMERSKLQKHLEQAEIDFERRSPELEHAQIDLKRAERQIRAAIDEMTPVTAKKVALETVETLRTALATADFSYTFRQALVLSARRPIQATRAFKKATKSFFHKYTAEQVDYVIRSAPHHYLREKSGLQLTEVGAMLTHHEEMFGSRLIERVPVIGDVVKASSRHMVTGLNILRASAFDEFFAKYPNASHAELTAWADWVNVASGRGNLGRAAAIANWLSFGVFAPKFSASRIQTPYRMFKYWKTPRVRKEIAKDMVAVAGLGGTALMLGDLAGFGVGVDPRSPDFGKILIGDKRIDLWGGLQQPIRVVARVGLAVTDKLRVTGRELAEQDKTIDPLALVGRFSEFKLAPAITIPREIIRGKTAVGEPATLTQTAIRAITPMWLSDVADAYRLENAWMTGITGGIAFLGVGVSTYRDSEATTRRKIRQMKLDNNYIGADQLQLAWNMRNPDKPIRSVSIE